MRRDYQDFDDKQVLINDLFRQNFNRNGTGTETKLALIIIFTGRNEVVAKVIFLHLFVILFTGEGVLPQCMLGYQPPPRDQADTPQIRHPPRSDTPPPPSKQVLINDLFRQNFNWNGTGTETKLALIIIFTGRNEVVAKVIFLHLFVILFTGEGVLPQCMLEYQPPPLGTRQTPPRSDPPSLDQTPPPPPGPGRPPLKSRLQHTVYERPVRILLECILVH